VVVLFATLCAVYLFSQFLRNSVGVIAPDIAADLALSPEALGVLSSVFFLSFAAVQVPLGVAIDRFGPRRCMLASIGLAVAGCVLFALSDSLLGLTAARVLMGLGCSSFFMAPLTIYTRWFRPEQFSTLTGVQLGIGTLGTLLATAPLAYSTALIGWRETFLVVAGATTVIGILAALVVRDEPPGRRREFEPPTSLRECVKGLAEVVRVPGFVPIFAMQFTSYSSFVSVLGLWGGPYLADVLDLDLSARGNVLLVMAAASIAGLFAWGPMDRVFGARKPMVELGVLTTAALLVVLGLAGDRSIAVAVVVLAALGLSSGYVSVLTAHGRALFTQDQVGRGMATINVGTIGGVFVMQMLTGAIIGSFESLGDVGERAVRPFVAYQAAFWLLALSLVAAWLVYRRAPDPRP
jgi:MFS family permease